MNIRLVGAAALAAFVAQSASAAIVVTTNQSLWTSAVSNFGVVATETFNGIPNGSYSSPLGRSVTPSAVGAPTVSWSAVAAGGLRVLDGVVSTVGPGVTLIFSFGPDVRAVAGNFFGTDINFGNATVLFTVELSNGTAYEGISSDPSTFTGFRSTNAVTISSLELTVVNAPGFAGGGDVYPSVDNLYFGVIPAPGAFAILGAASLVGFSLRRR